jgi:hypothetical protein
MKEGLLWFDKDPDRPLSDKVKRAALRYQARFHRPATVCYVNTADFEGQTASVNGIQLRPAGHVLRHHLWIGVEEQGSLSKAA